MLYYDIYYVIISHIDNPKTFYNIALTCKFLASICLLITSQKKIEFLKNIRKESPYGFVEYSIFPNGKKVKFYIEWRFGKLTATSDYLNKDYGNEYLVNKFYMKLSSIITQIDI
jgi:hypothetical protein